jgi:hypothetical protein
LLILSTWDVWYWFLQQGGWGPLRPPIPFKCDWCPCEKGNWTNKFREKMLQGTQGRGHLLKTGLSQVPASQGSSEVARCWRETRAAPSFASRGPGACPCPGEDDCLSTALRAAAHGAVKPQPWTFMQVEAAPKLHFVFSNKKKMHMISLTLRSTGKSQGPGSSVRRGLNPGSSAPALPKLTPVQQGTQEGRRVLNCKHTASAG